MPASAWTWVPYSPVTPTWGCSPVNGPPHSSHLFADVRRFWVIAASLLGFRLDSASFFSRCGLGMLSGKVGKFHSPLLERTATPKNRSEVHWACSWHEVPNFRPHSRLRSPGRSRTLVRPNDEHGAAGRPRGPSMRPPWPWPGRAPRQPASVSSPDTHPDSRASLLGERP